ncbi:hypothetical protein BO70DRAFT_360521 [Aspergillus heteromorphus CBS 117.55]|uniref:AA1-like domain-containing protein n=1 Tax=Aspergillus heteromorphus CBS 117.55 TaxID=1448321 RepID=A0A317WK30_9EURO|nr:uncharacterized protein BO70DRAFT_360521 [Aspergillus heteromorphus CBS 117.55]PWY86814.1 hypothetical protein BO70DRAFT_360521 [Aspergillus heteromorphus CBS 117.55]
MKLTTTITTLLLAAATTTLALPTAQPNAYARALKPFQITGLTAKILSDIDYASLTLNLVDQNANNTATSCTWWWHTDKEVLTTNVWKCENTNYGLQFPDGMKSNIDDFTLRVETTSSATVQEAGEVKLDASASGSNWVCQQNPTENVKEQCTYNGELDIPV